MKDRKDILAELATAKPELQRNFKVSRLALFGSYARNEQTAASDVDILVEVDPSIGMEFITLAEKLEEHLGLHVDLVSRRGVKPNRWTVIEPDLIYV
ncbi:MAG: nucleotidyltransferase family protein [Verrucomicrobia bacterium]|nr:nucleotidyltransferase family protein [Verrucomicrobiota bacterium]